MEKSGKTAEPIKLARENSESDITKVYMIFAIFIFIYNLTYKYEHEKNWRPVKPGLMRVEGMKSGKKLFFYNSKKYNYENSKDDTGNAPKTKIQKKNIRRRLTICSGNKPTKLIDFERMLEAEQLK